MHPPTHTQIPSAPTPAALIPRAASPTCTVSSGRRSFAKKGARPRRGHGEWGWGSWAETAAAWTPREAPSVRAPSHPEGLARSPRVPRPLPRRLLCLLILQAWGLGWPAGRVDRRGGGGHRDWAGHGGHGHWELGAGRGGLSLGREAWRGWAGFGLRSRVHGDRGPALASEPSLWRWALSVGWTVGPRSVSRVVQCEWVFGTHVQRGSLCGGATLFREWPQVGGAWGL